jgi:2-(1,2-epoxy-1,2-dihydrophenyl)acetyl-CoA isomerase
MLKIHRAHPSLCVDGLDEATQLDGGPALVQTGRHLPMTDRRLAISIEESVARICLIRPDAANTIDLVFAKEFEAAAEACVVGRARVVLVTAVGRQFCGGGDLKSFADQADLGAHLEEVTHHLHAGLATFVEMNAPVVVAVQGAVAGAGMGLVCAADIVVAGKLATFVMAYTRLGLTPDGSSSWFLPQHVGLRRALDLTLTNRVLSADEALAWGLITRLVADDQLLKEAESIIEQLASGPTAAYGASARLLRSAAGNTLRTHLRQEADALVERARAVDGLEGIRSFVERRSVNFIGD